MNLLANSHFEKYRACPMDHQGGQQRTFHGFMLDSARCQENRSYYRNMVDFVAERGMSTLVWHFSDDQGCSLQFESVPGIASPNAYSKLEMRELIEYAKSRGIEIVPELASLGHCRYLTQLPDYQHLNETESHFTGMCPVSSETRSIISKLIQETVEVFDSKNFHVGMDEVNIGDHPLTRAALETNTKAELLTDYIRFLHGLVSATGRRVWMWGDMLLKYPEMLAQISKDILICNWQYEPHASPATTQILLDVGFDVMLCSALISHDQPLFPGDRFAVTNVRTLQSKHALVGQGQVVGHINTVWTPVRFLADSMWVGIDLAAAIICESGDIDAGNQAEVFGQTFYGLNAVDSSRFSQAVLLLISHSPLRKEWFAVVKLSPLSPAELDQVTQSSAAFIQARQLLTGLSKKVQKHLKEYRTFSLLVDLLEHSYKTAVAVADDTPFPEMLQRGQAILQRVDQTWDDERFAEDPRKYTASHSWFQDDHLIPLLQTGLAELKKKLEESISYERVTGAESKIGAREISAV